MVVYNFNIVGIYIFKTEDDTPLHVYADAPETLKVSAKAVKSVAWWRHQVFHLNGLIKNIKHLTCSLDNALKELSAGASQKQFFGLFISEVNYHNSIYNQFGYISRAVSS
jgi:hypothetical protein